MASGFEQIDGIWYYFRSWGGMAQNTFLTHKNNIYHVDTDGKMTTGWLLQDGTWYYFRSWGGMYRSTFFKAPTGSALYYADENGKMAVGKNRSTVTGTISRTGAACIRMHSSKRNECLPCGCRWKTDRRLAAAGQYILLF